MRKQRRRSDCEAAQRLCFRYMDSTIPLLSKSKISSLYPYSVLVQPGLCRTCSGTTLLVFPRGGLLIMISCFLLIRKYNLDIREARFHTNKFDMTKVFQKYPHSTNVSKKMKSCQFLRRNIIILHRYGSSQSECI